MKKINNKEHGLEHAMAKFIFLEEDDFEVEDEDVMRDMAELRMNSYAK